jgi:ABC-type multidrug transport system fused ATPase/permease subunit
MQVYRRLLAFLHPHRLRLIANIVANVIAAIFDVLAFSLLAPFLNVLFGLDQPIP